ncbi:MAG: DUF6481 family protein [Phenylobacterium sp.]|jgi:hypothetical protein|uniref:DUF6481 family protein n=1 Tax=Phenylobacterium sp. TaxID=1871053 RepID=UPI002A297D53|nr:DUF6481 family protein [Phenylobacterium sp.]MDD3838207.1 DUF6481 family protein [Phenylobacterium sp.]MDX9997466.1 DUF6481 family protein [Phenylobacterium sp.]
MKPFKPISFEDRLAAQAEAKKAMLEKFKPKPAERKTPYVDTAAQRQAELERIRAERQTAREAKRAAQAEAERQREEAAAKDREAQASLRAANARAALLAMYGAKRRGGGSK